jgi:hypothetical protein
MTNPFRVLKQMIKYHSTYDIEKALRRQLWKGMEIGRKQVNTTPCCDLHATEPLRAIAPGLFACQQCRQISQPMPVTRPTVKLSPEMLRDRHTDSVALPAKMYSQARRAGAGPQTAASAAISNRRGK